MKYTENGDTITLEMDREDYTTLLITLGAALGTTFRKRSGIILAMRRLGQPNQYRQPQFPAVHHP